ncbi:DUF1566 domain-containing protein [Geobacter pelophilus]|jgi:hypothetical protein|uniref:DUF1566 domain-containing protein n=2 Tax=Geoanaerobacter pelophilus TaxID=60036 RepID=A0AAW4L4R3_9BACT|nr:DUF1566 domain-containing protein [Geoanaerobacter pelophilus]
MENEYSIDYQIFLAQEESIRHQAIDECLAHTGWDYRYQFISNTNKQASDLLDNIYSCIKRDNELNHSFDDIINQLSPSGPKSKTHINCLTNYGWQVITMAPWVTADTINDKSVSIINIPLNSSILKISDDPENNIFKDTNSALSWTIVEDKEVYSWESAATAIENLNRKGFGGSSDWHIPSKAEIEQLISGKSEATLRSILYQMSSSSNLQGKCYLYWTSTAATDTPEKYYAFDLFSNSFSLVDSFGPFACKLIVVRGKGWNKFSAKL